MPLCLHTDSTVHVTPQQHPPLLQAGQSACLQPQIDLHCLVDALCGGGGLSGGASVTLTPYSGQPRPSFSSILVFWPWPPGLWPGTLLLDPEQETHAVGREKQGLALKGASEGSHSRGG